MHRSGKIAPSNCTRFLSRSLSIHAHTHERMHGSFGLSSSAGNGNVFSLLAYSLPDTPPPPPSLPPALLVPVRAKVCCTRAERASISSHRIASHRIASHPIHVTLLILWPALSCFDFPPISLGFLCVFVSHCTCPSAFVPPTRLISGSVCSGRDRPPTPTPTSTTRFSTRPARC